VVAVVPAGKCCGMEAAKEALGKATVASENTAEIVVAASLAEVESAAEIAPGFLAGIVAVVAGVLAVVA
jgi:xanthine/uracil/vitamin C permease (AzgA family)